MAQVLPAKRSRGLAPDALSSVHGMAGPSHSKRRRLSAQPSERSYSEDVQSQRADEESENEEDDEREFLRATQGIVKSFQKQGQENIPAEAGIIEEVRCTNFMCHDQLTVTLGPLINFIIGQNGSGKSAVLTALTVCLGGKATATNRGQSLKSLIKEGRDFCVLSVRMKNTGSMAYKPEQYGDSIIAERHFNRAGTSGFKIKDRNGKIVSTKKAELEDIVDAFALQLDNPMNVLTQDQARQFLNHSTPKDKYRFFLKGTQLENLNNDYKQIEHELEEQEAKAQTLLGDLKVYRDNYEKARDKAKRAGKLEELRAREQQLYNQAVWASVEGEEQKLADIETELERVRQLIDGRKAEADAESEKFDQANAALENANQQLAECQAEVQPASDEVEECRAKFSANTQKVMQFKADERQLLGQLKANQKAVTDTQSQIQEHRSRQAGADNGLYAQKLEEFENAKIAHEESKAAWEAHDNALSGLTKDLTSAQQEKKQADAKLSDKRGEESASRRKINDLEKGQRQWIDAYDKAPALAKLLSAIERESTFREKPVGPMGRYVELLHSEWGSILEKQFGSALNAFVVTSKADQTILSGMMKRHNWQAPVYIGSKTPIDTSRNEPEADLLTWLRVLKISNDLVRNQLIINQSIEQVVLIRSRDEATNFMDSGGPRLRNVRMCFCMSDRSRREGHSLTFNPQTGSSNLSPIQEYRGQHRMQADKTAQVQDEKENLASIRREVANFEAAAQDAQNHLNTCQARTQAHKRQKTALKIQMDEAHDSVGTLEDEVNACTPDVAAIATLEQDLAVAKGQVELDEGQYANFLVEKDQADAEARSLKSLLDDATKVLQESQLRLDKVSTKITTLTQRRVDALRRKNEALTKVEDAEKNEAEWDEQRSALLDKIQNQSTKASEICSRVPVPAGETFESLGRQVEANRVAREAAEKELGGSEEELVTIANDAKKAYVDAQKLVGDTHNVRRVLKVALQTRQERWKTFRMKISMRARVTFNYLLSERRFRGSLSVDHKNQRLDIHIQPDITVMSDAGRQTKTLSGGEKSFSTICLLLSLWDAMGSPIRCLDEFDVFMDQANRDVTMKLIIGAARKSVGRQYILITPQAISNAGVGNADDVKIIRLANPERGQTALNFSG